MHIENIIYIINIIFLPGNITMSDYSHSESFSCVSGVVGGGSKRAIELKSVILTSAQISVKKGESFSSLPTIG